MRLAFLTKALALAVVLGLVVRSQGEPIEEEEDVLVLTDANFEGAIKANPLLLVEFYAPWCGHCKSLAPEYAKAAATLKQENIRIAKLDATVQTEVAKKYEVNGFPTIKLFKDGAVLDYGAGRQADDIVKYMRKKSKPAGPVTIEEEDSVLVLDEDNFEKAIKENPLLLVEFYAPWCGHCKSLAPEYAKAAATLKQENIRIAKVDATESGALAQKYSVQGFPTIKLLKGDQVLDYTGGRTADDIVTYMKKKSGPAAAKLSKLEEAKAFVEANKKVVLGFFKETDDAMTKFIALADADDSLTYAFTSEKSVMNNYKGQSFGSIRIITEAGEFTLKDFAKKSDAELAKWLQGHKYESLMEFNMANGAGIFQGPVKQFVAVFMDPDADQKGERAAIKPVVENYRDQLLSVYFPKSESRVLEWFGVDAAELPVLAIADMSDETNAKKYRFEGDMKKGKEVEKFIKDFLGGKVAQFLKSEKPSPEDTKGPVTVVKGKSFEEIVLKSNKDVLVEFYAPWCGHCKQLEPKYEELGKLLQDNKVDSVVIAKMDSTANEADGVTIQGFPTLMFYPAKDKANPITYQGAREVDDLLKFIKEKASHKIPDIKIESKKEEAKPAAGGGLQEYLKRAPQMDATVAVEEDVLVLTDQNFHKAIKENPTLLVEFYAPWCGHCKHLAPEYAKAAATLKQDNVRIAKVDATVHKEAAAAFGIRGYPTMKLIKNGEVSEYEGGRQAADIVKFMLVAVFYKDGEVDATGGATSGGIQEEENVLVLTNDNIDQALKANPLLLVEFYAPWCGHCKHLVPEYAKAAGMLKKENIRIAKLDYTTNQASGEKYGIKAFPTLKLFQNTQFKEDYNGARKAEDIAEYMRKAAQAAGVDLVAAGDEVDELDEFDEALDEDDELSGDTPLVLTEDTIEAAIKEHDVIMVEFFAPWCGHCQELGPKYDKAARILQREDGLVAAKIDVAASESIIEKYSLEGLPTIRVYKGDTGYEYTGDRTTEAIVAFMRKKAGPASAKLDAMEDGNEFFEENESAVLLYVQSDAPGDATLEKFLKLAGMDDDHAYAYTTNAEIMAAFEGKWGSVQLYSNEGDFQLEDFASVDEEEFARWVHGNSLPLPVIFNENPDIFQGPIYAYMVAFYDEDVDDYKEHIEVLGEAMEALRTKILTVAVPKDQTNLMEVFGVEVSTLPRLVIGDLRTGQLLKYHFNGDILDGDEVEQFAKNFLEGKLTPILKSEEPSPEDTKGPVIVLKGKTFNEIVNDTSKDVLVEFYAPWCGHCQHLAPRYEKVGSLLADNGVEDVVIAKIDMTANDVNFPGLMIEGYPTILFFPAAKKSTPISFDGEREVPDILEFLQKHTTKELPFIDYVAVEGEFPEMMEGDFDEEDGEEWQEVQWDGDAANLMGNLDAGNVRLGGGVGLGDEL